MKKLILNITILSIISLILVFGVYILNEYIIKTEDVVEIFRQDGDEFAINRNNNNQENKNPYNSIEYASNNLNQPKNDFYYNQLDDNAKLVYSKILENKENMKSGNYTIEFGKTFNELLNSENGENSLNTSFQAALYAYFLDYPDVFYLDVSKMYLLISTKSFGKKTTYTVSISGENEVSSNYYAEGFYSKEQVEECIQKIDKTSNEIINNTSENTYEKVKELHNWLIDNIEYDQTLNNNNIRNIYGAFEEKTVVCEGYAKAYKYLLDRIGIENIIAVGQGVNSQGQTEEHAWNYLKLNDKWYAVDVTWDDPIINQNIKLPDKYKYSYFLKGSNNFKDNHIEMAKIPGGDVTFTYPELNISDYE